MNPKEVWWTSPGSVLPITGTMLAYPELLLNLGTCSGDRRTSLRSSTRALSRCLSRRNPKPSKDSQRTKSKDAVQRGDLSKDYATRHQDSRYGDRLEVRAGTPRFGGKKNFVKNKQSINPGSAVRPQGLTRTQPWGSPVIGDPHNNWGQHFGQ